MAEQSPGARSWVAVPTAAARPASWSASHPELVEGLVLLSYPLHPPGKPAQLRTAHFSTLRTPSLFVSGTKDAFGTIDELEAAIKLIPARTELVKIDGASHGLSKQGSAKGVAGVVTRAFQSFFA